MRGLYRQPVISAFRRKLQLRIPTKTVVIMGSLAPLLPPLTLPGIFGQVFSTVSPVTFERFTPDQDLNDQNDHCPAVLSASCPLCPLS